MKNNRSDNVQRNIIYSFVLRSIGILLSFLLLPLTVHYLSVIEYGVWVTLFSVMNWVNFLDMGIGLGLRNKLAEAVSENNLENIQTYLSTGIAAMIGIGMLFGIIFFLFINMVNLQFIFNTQELSESDLYKVVFWTGFFIILTFVLSIINQIYYAYQKAAVAGVIQIMHNFIMLIIIYFLTLQINHNMFHFVLSFGAASIFSKSYFIIYFFYKNKNLCPRIKYIKWLKIKDISTLGIKFFIIQLTCIVMFSGSNILITQCLGPDQVQSYDIVFKIFTVLTMAHGIFCAPLWNAYTDAYIKKDFSWIKNTLEKMICVTAIFSIASIIIIWKINIIVGLFLKINVDIPPYLTVCMGGYTIALCWLYVWNTFLNGIGIINFQMYVSIIAAIVILPLSWFLMLKIGVAGMALAMMITTIIIGILMFLQSRRILLSLKKG